MYYHIGYVDLFHAVRFREFAFRVTRVSFTLFALEFRLFKKAVSLVGTDPKSGKLWDSYVMYETSCVGGLILFVT